MELSGSLAQMNKFVMQDFIAIEQMVDMHHHNIVIADWETLHVKHRNCSPPSW
jgi:hypothetical protein